MLQDLYTLGRAILLNLVNTLASLDNPCCLKPAILQNRPGLLMSNLSHTWHLNKLPRLFKCTIQSKKGRRKQSGEQDAGGLKMLSGGKRPCFKQGEGDTKRAGRRWFFFSSLEFLYCSLYTSDLLRLWLILLPALYCQLFEKRYQRYANMLFLCCKRKVVAISKE